MIVTTVSYSIMFHIFKKTREHPVQCSVLKINNPPLRRPSTFHIFLNSRFKVSAFLVTNFFLLVIVPDMVYLLLDLLKYKDQYPLVGNIVWMLFMVSHISDAFIYIFHKET